MSGIEIGFAIAAAASMAVSAAGAVSQGISNAKTAKFNEKVAHQNATLARQQAELQARQTDRENRRREGQLRAAIGPSGGSSEGSAIDVLGDVVYQGELERQTVLFRGEIGQAGFLNTASLESSRAKNAPTAGYLRAGSEVLGGVSSTLGSINTSRSFRSLSAGAS